MDLYAAAVEAELAEPFASLLANRIPSFHIFVAIWDWGWVSFWNAAGGILSWLTFGNLLKTVLLALFAERAVSRLPGIFWSTRRLVYLQFRTSLDGQLISMAYSGESDPSFIHPSTTATTNSAFFRRLPPEIRRVILVAAFGDKILHMGLDLLRDDHYRTWEELYYTISQGYRQGAELPYSGVSWQWSGCVCRRHKSDESRLPFGRRGNSSVFRASEPGYDDCLTARRYCLIVPGQSPDAYRIGIMGWLLTCRQAYIEGVEVLYRTNTFHISSPVMLSSMHQIMYPRLIQCLVSLELRWNPRLLRLNHAFDTMTSHRATPRHPLFPALRHLRISFKALSARQRDYATGLPHRPRSIRQMGRRLHQYTYPSIDSLLDQMVPVSAEVTISCLRWKWYEQTDSLLFEIQGLENTMPQKSEMGGIKCWRMTPEESTGEDESSTGIKRGKEAGPQRRGFWIHASKNLKNLEAESRVPAIRARQRVYGVGPPDFSVA